MKTPDGDDRKYYITGFDDVSDSGPEETTYPVETEDFLATGWHI